VRRKPRGPPNSHSAGTALRRGLNRAKHSLSRDNPSARSVLKTAEDCPPQRFGVLNLFGAAGASMAARVCVSFVGRHLANDEMGKMQQHGKSRGATAGWLVQQ